MKLHRGTWIIAAIVISGWLVAAGPAPAHEMDCDHTHPGGGTTACDDSVGDSCTTEKGAEGVCRQRLRHCRCEPKDAGPDSDGTVEVEAPEDTENGEGTGPATSRAPGVDGAGDADDPPAPPLDTALTTADALTCSYTCFGHSCSIECREGGRARCDCRQKKMEPNGWQWLPSCRCL